MLLWHVATDRNDNFWTVMYGLAPLEQSLVATRLGPAAVYNPKHPSGHWLLDLANPGHEEVARRLKVAPSTLYRHLPGGRSTIAISAG